MEKLPMVRTFRRAAFATTARTIFAKRRFLMRGQHSLKRCFAVACTTLCCTPAAGLSAPARVISFSTRDDFVLKWNILQISKELGVPPDELESTQEDKPYTDEFEAAYQRRQALGLAPFYRIALPPLSSGECFVRNSADIASAGWAAFQLACCDMRSTVSALMTDTFETTGQLTKSVSVQQIGPCDHKGGLTENRASLEALAALPESEHDKLDHISRECDAAGALWCRLKEEGHRLQKEGKPWGAEKAFERAGRAKAAYLSLCHKCYRQYLDDISRVGWAGKYYADRLGRMDDAIDQMLIDCTKLREQGKEQAVVETIARAEQIQAQHDLLYRDLRWKDGDEVDRCLEKDRDADVPYGTTYRLEMTLASPPALQVD